MMNLDFTFYFLFVLDGLPEYFGEAKHSFSFNFVSVNVEVFKGSVEFCCALEGILEFFGA